MGKKKYGITIEETISEEFIVYAENSEEAMKIAEGKYNTEEFILAPGNLTSKQMAITSPENEVTEWTEF